MKVSGIQDDAHPLRLLHRFPRKSSLSAQWFSSYTNKIEEVFHVLDFVGTESIFFFRDTNVANFQRVTILLSRMNVQLHMDPTNVQIRLNFWGKLYFSIVFRSLTLGEEYCWRWWSTWTFPDAATSGSVCSPGRTCRTSWPAPNERWCSPKPSSVNSKWMEEKSGLEHNLKSKKNAHVQC